MKLVCAKFHDDSPRLGGSRSITGWVNRTRLSRLVSRFRRLHHWYWRAFHRTANNDGENVYYQEIRKRK